MKNFKTQDRIKLKKMQNAEKYVMLLTVISYIILLLLNITNVINLIIADVYLITVLAGWIVGQKLYNQKLLKIPTEQKVEKYRDVQSTYGFVFLSITVFILFLILFVIRPFSILIIIAFLISLIITIGKMYKTGVLYDCIKNMKKV